jgi:hypothetical protein
LLNTIVEDLSKLTITGPQAEAILRALTHAVSSVDYEVDYDDDVSLPAHSIGHIYKEINDDYNSITLYGLPVHAKTAMMSSDS